MALVGLLLGHGHMGRLHAAALAERDDVRLVVVDPPLGLRPPVPRQPDFAIVAAPTALHAELALPLLERGVPCLVEKPLATNPRDAEALARHPHLSVGMIERFNPVLRVVEGVRPRYVQAERLGPYPAPGGPRAGRGPRGTDVDVVHDLMVHDLDLLGLFLDGPVREVRAVGVGVGGRQPDIAEARVEMASGVALLAASRVSREARRHLRLVDEGTWWSLDLRARTARRVRWGDGNLDAEELPVPERDPLRDEHAAFLAAVRSGGGFPCPGAEAVATLRLARAILHRIEAFAAPAGSRPG